MKAGKWNREKREYEPYELPAGAKLYSDDMDAECECAQCGRKMKFGDGYTSLEIQTEIGFGYCICGDCRNEEIVREAKAQLKETERKKK